jgi:hypothetical protein
MRDKGQFGITLTWLLLRKVKHVYERVNESPKLKPQPDESPTTGCPKVKLISSKPVC